MKKMIMTSALFASFSLFAQEGKGEFNFPRNFCRDRQQFAKSNQEALKNEVIHLAFLENINPEMRRSGLENFYLDINGPSPDSFYLEGRKYPISQASHPTEFSPTMMISCDWIASTEGSFSKLTFLSTQIKTILKNGKAYETSAEFDFNGSSLILFPQITKPGFELNENDIEITLSTNEKLLYETNGTYISGPFEKIQVTSSTNRKRFQYRLNYTGKALAIDMSLDQKGNKLPDHVFSVRLNGKECLILDRDITETDWDSGCLNPKFENEAKLSEFLEKRCGFGIPTL